MELKYSLIKSYVRVKGSRKACMKLTPNIKRAELWKIMTAILVDKDLEHVHIRFCWRKHLWPEMVKKNYDFRISLCPGIQFGFAKLQ